MALPLFPPESDPGPDFVGLLRQAGGGATPRRRVGLQHPARRGAPRHHRGGPALRGRRDHGRRPPRHHGQHHRPPGHGEGLPGRPPFGGGDRRLGGNGRRDGPPLPGAARALREGRGHGRSPSRARPTSWPRWCASTCPWPCRGSPWCRSSPATTRLGASGASSATTPPAATTRRPTSRPPARGAGTPARPSSSASVRG